MYEKFSLRAFRDKVSEHVALKGKHRLNPHSDYHRETDGICHKIIPLLGLSKRL